VGLDAALAELGMLAAGAQGRREWQEADKVRRGQGSLAPLYRVPCLPTLDPAAPRSSSVPATSTHLHSSSSPHLLPSTSPHLHVNAQFVTSIRLGRCGDRHEKMLEKYTVLSELNPLLLTRANLTNKPTNTPKSLKEVKCDS